MRDKAPRRFKRFYEEECEFEILTLAIWFSHYSYSRMSIHSSMGGWLGKYSMLLKVLRSKKKEKRKKAKNRKMKKRRKEKKTERKKRRIKCFLALFGFINFPSYFERTIPYSNLPTICNPITKTSFVSRDHPFTTCTCPPI